MKGHLVTAEHHRAVSEAVNHRMWDITSGSLEWKLNSSSPDVQWQIHDWYLRPMVSLYYDTTSWRLNPYISSTVIWTGW
jgi:hypothetical protein